MKIYGPENTDLTNNDSSDDTDTNNSNSDVTDTNNNTNDDTDKNNILIFRFIRSFSPLPPIMCCSLF